MRSGCPFCQHSRSSLYREKQPLREGGIGNILKCDECGLLYPQIRMGKNEAEEYLSTSDAAYNSDLGFEDPRVELTGSNPVVKLLHDVAIRGRSLDIGTWSGMYTYIFEALGFDFYGLEPQKPAVEFAQTKGVNVLHGSFPEISLQHF